MRILIYFVVALAPMWAGKKALSWEPAKVESSFYQMHHGARFVPYNPDLGTNTASVHESIYIDAGEWLYHVSREVTPRGILRLADQTRIEVAVDGKTLVMHIGGKQYSAKIEQKSRGGTAPSRR